MHYFPLKQELPSQGFVPSYEHSYLIPQDHSISAFPALFIDRVLHISFPCLKGHQLLPLIRVMRALIGS